MAVLIEGTSVVIRLEAIHRQFPGGWQAFKLAAPNKTLCADNELIRVGFMQPMLNTISMNWCVWVYNICPMVVPQLILWL